ncbi:MULTISPECIES: GntR family transcriptional regulator [Eubacterium]|uniref:DNA-binding transcriptional regulator, GntR family n=1 Tax=Eubacterium barkeri TaxID=1528 RepID=A0A1H3AKJ7_EUBBA|nr:GntR family transcriptional regulator [Eubacterium barkeri]SDX29971.1 DNA-binding transcriptional regulator, GntR family [Eubacterium barkeri]
MKETTLLQVQAYDYLIDIIKKGELESGHIYSLNQMAQKIGISKTPLRDAVLRLEQERYIDILPSKGFRLHTMTREDIVETYQIRNAIEAYCLRELCRHLDTDEGQACLAKLQRKIDTQKTIADTTGSTEDFARKDYEFHRSMVQFVGNATMLEMYRSFMYRIFWLNVTSFSRAGRMQDTVAEHQHMMAMIRSRDIIGLEEQLDHHLNIAQHINLDMLEK